MNGEKETPKWKKFERLVAAIHVAEQEGATVKWDDEIDGRQFDVTIRFKEGFYEYLTVIECKDYSTPVPVEKVEAFVTKSKRAKADKAIMFSSTGFQSGAIKVAAEEKISLITLKNLQESSVDNLTEKFLPNICLTYSFRFRLTNPNHFIIIPEEIGVLRSMMRDTKIIGKEINTTPEELVNQNIEEIEEKVTETPQTFEVLLPQGTKMIHVNELYEDTVTSFLFDYCLIPISKLTTTKGLGVDPYLSGDVYEFKDEIGSTSKFIDRSEYNLGFDTKIKEKHFYKNPNLDFSYYCESVDGNEVTMWLIESYQANGLLQAIASTHITNTTQFVEVTDGKEIKRLRKIYLDFKKKINENS